MKRLFLFALIIFTSSHLFSQSSKISLSLLKKINQAETLRQQDREIALFLEGDVNGIKSIVEQLGGTYKYAAGNISAIRIPISKVNDLASSGYVKWIEDNNLVLKPMNDQAIVNNHAWEVQNGINLPQGYDGKGVVVGIIDEGIDFTHPDFRNTNGTTRIKYLWDHTLISTDTSVVPNPYNYGVEFVGGQIDTSTQHLDTDFGHGTHVAGIACGNGNALNNYKGMAPASDIIVVKVNINGSQDNFLNSLVDAVKYIFDKAQAMNEPAVINISLGTYFGSHDGNDIQAQAIANLVTSANGRVVVAAAGNLGYSPIHLGYDVSADTSMTWFQYSNNGYIYFEMWSDTGSFENVQFAVGVDQVKPYYAYRGGMPFKNVTSFLNIDTYDTIYNSNHQRMGIIEHRGQLLHGAYTVQYAIKPDSVLNISGTDSSKYFWRFMSTGSGRLDAWSSDMVFDGLPDANTFPPVAYYQKPDLTQNIVSSFQCRDEVITVGSYDNRRVYSNAHYQPTYDTLYPPYTRIYPGALSFFTSHGPTRDGRIKPDITATGGWILSTGPYYFINSLLAVSFEKVAAGSKHFRNSGTSMASPTVAGICALYLQKNPNASWLDVKNALLNCATQDGYTGSNLPNSTWGYGKANAYKMVAGCAINIEENNFYNAELSNYPNPFDEYTIISYDLTSLSHYNTAEIQIMDVLGKSIQTFSIKDRSNSIHIKKDQLRSGIYFFSLVIDGKVAKTNKLVAM